MVLVLYLVETLTGLSGKGKYSLPRLGSCDLIEFFRSHLSDRRQLEKVFDSRLEEKYPLKGALHLALLALTCLDPEPKSRPWMKEVVETLQHIQSAPGKPKIHG